MSTDVLFFARDPGGANAIAPLIIALNNSDYHIKVFAKDVALKRLEDAIDISGIIDTISEQNVYAFLKKDNPKYIVTGTSADDYTEKYLWKAAKKLNITSYAVLDQWINYGVRFSKYSVSELTQFYQNPQLDYMPDKIFVMDHVCRDEMIKEGIPEECMIISGHPFFETIIKKSEKMDMQEVLRLKKQLVNNSENKLIVFASEPISKTYKECDDGFHFFGYSERTILKVFLDTILKAKIKTTIILRLHPKENEHDYDDVIREYDTIHILKDRKMEAHQLMKVADLVVGMSSMFLIESMMMGAKILSVQIGLSRENPFVFDRIGVIKSILTKAELEEKLATVFNESQIVNFNFDIHRNAVNNIRKYIFGEE